MKKVTTLYKINTVLVVAMALALPAACIYGIVDEAIHPAKLEARREKAAEHRGEGVDLLEKGLGCTLPE